MQNRLTSIPTRAAIALAALVAAASAEPLVLGVCRTLKPGADGARFQSPTPSKLVWL